MTEIYKDDVSSSCMLNSYSKRAPKKDEKKKHKQTRSLVTKGTYTESTHENVEPSEGQLNKKAFQLFSTPLDRGGIMAEMKIGNYVN
jgi:hypothetical protein